ncbi:hypothetical protein [Halomonas ramblicola]|uniref:hypothetical protein n=1 Tax=Halomonas ramblicola TaxID=747349 RepID=UPI0025B408D1|nr:hypothetical protein [Halomonas ramblicola]MDN3520825.1 hypothetical protein [Halomonas ramblicola]
MTNNVTEITSHSLLFLTSNTASNEGFISGDAVAGLAGAVIGALLATIIPYKLEKIKERKDQNQAKSFLYDEILGIQNLAQDTMKDCHQNAKLNSVKKTTPFRVGERQPILPKLLDTRYIEDKNLVLKSGVPRKFRRDLGHLIEGAYLYNGKINFFRNEQSVSLHEQRPRFNTTNNFEIYMSAINTYYLCSILLGEIDDHNEEPDTDMGLLKELKKAKDYAENKVGVKIDDPLKDAR